VLDRVTTHGIELDVCGEHGTWFDAFELRHLVAILRGEVPAGNPATQRRIRCSSCKETLTADRGNLTDDGIQCDGCWRGRQAAVFTAAQAQHDQSSAVAIGGALLGVAAVMLGAASAGSRS
jgi:Zn-finger nucleic acid-binding protein